MKSDKMEQINKNEEMSSFDKAKENYYDGGYIGEAKEYIKELEQQAERDHNIICELNNDNIILKQQNAELFKILASVKKIIDIYELYNDLSVELFYDDLEKLLKEYKG